MAETIATPQPVQGVDREARYDGSWRVEAARRADELESLAEWIRSRDHAAVGQDAQLWKAIGVHIGKARELAGADDDRRRWRRFFSPTDSTAVDATLGNLDAAEASLLRMAPSEYLVGFMPSAQAQINRYLPKNDPRREGVDDAVHESKRTHKIEEPARDLVVQAYHAAGSQRRRELLRVASFFSVLVGTTIVLTVVALAVGAFGALWPHAMPLCFVPESGGDYKVVCPINETRVTQDGVPLDKTSGDLDEGLAATRTGADIAVVEFAGLIAAALAAATVLRGLRGTSTPYRVPLGLALLKLPAGALTAVVGLLLMRGGFVPGLSALDTSAQIIAWAVLFGYAQQLLTQLVDRQANGVLSNVAGRGAGGERELQAS
jgi:hypothetical protein